MASSSARGIFLYPRAFVVRNVAMTKPVVTSHTDTMGRALAQPDMSGMCPTLHAKPTANFRNVRFSRTSIADEMREEHRRRVLGE
jgi:hypothetical protein